MNDQVLVKVAVYGTLRKDGQFHHHLEKSKYLGTEELSGWGMVSMDDQYPAVDRLTTKRNITVEVYEVDPDVLHTLNVVEGFVAPRHPDNFYDSTVVLTSHGPAYIYYLPGCFNKGSMIDNGDWMTYLYNRGHG